MSVFCLRMQDTLFGGFTGTPPGKPTFVRIIYSLGFPYSPCSWVWRLRIHACIDRVPTDSTRGPTGRQAAGIHRKLSKSKPFVFCKIQFTPLKQPWLTLLFVGIYRGINIPGFLRWCELDFVHPQYLQAPSQFLLFSRSTHHPTRFLEPSQSRRPSLRLAASGLRGSASAQEAFSEEALRQRAEQRPGSRRSMGSMALESMEGLSSSSLWVSGRLP